MIIEKTCIVCPVGCHLKIEEDKNAQQGYIVTGNNCPRGEKYAIKEMIAPERVVTSTVKINGVTNLVLPVKTTDGIPKEKVLDFMKNINSVAIDLPINRGDIIIENIYDTGVNLVATKSIRV